jgi:predicted DNA-binding transcriptional regulator YafY
MAEKEWYTIQELADMFGVSYSKLRGEINALSNINAIKVRSQPGNQKVQEISKDSIATVKQATGA